MFDGLIVAKDIRNEFAHGKDQLSFEDEMVSDELEKLKFVGNYAVNWQQNSGPTCQYRVRQLPLRV